MAEFEQKPLPKFYSTSRELRNEAEKQRRNKLNHHVSELAALIPYVAKAQKKVDKTSILRLAASYLRLHNVVNRSEYNCSSSSFLNFGGGETLRTLLNSIGGFLLVLSSSGKVVYVSESIEEHFGYTQADVLGRCFYSLIHPDDVQLFQSQFEPKDSPRRSFYCRLSEKGGTRNDKIKYEIIHIVGHLKPFDFTRHDSQASQPTKPLLRRRRRRTSQRSSTSTSSIHDEGGLEEPRTCSVSPLPALSPSYSSPPCSPNDWDHQRQSLASDTHIMVAFVDIVRDRPITEMLWVESLRDEYITRHRTDGSVVYADHRISFVIGMMPEEVVGKSAFEYMHLQDVLWSIIAQKQMLMNPQGQGTVTSRLRCRNGSFVALRSRGYLEVNKDTGKVDTFVCVNTVINDDISEEETKNQRKSLVPYIDFDSPRTLFECIASDLPYEFRKLIKSLINPETYEMMKKSVDWNDLDSSSRSQVQITELPSTAHSEEGNFDPGMLSNPYSQFIMDDTNIDLDNASAILGGSSDYLPQQYLFPQEVSPSSSVPSYNMDVVPFSPDEVLDFAPQPSHHFVDGNAMTSEQENPWPKRRGSNSGHLTKLMRCDDPAEGVVSGSLSVVTAKIGNNDDLSLSFGDDHSRVQPFLDCSLPRIPKVEEVKTEEQGQPPTEYILSGHWRNSLESSFPSQHTTFRGGVPTEPPWGLYDSPTSQ